MEAVTEAVKRLERLQERAEQVRRILSATAEAVDGAPVSSKVLEGLALVVDGLLGEEQER